MHSPGRPPSSYRRSERLSEGLPTASSARRRSLPSCAAWSRRTREPGARSGGRKGDGTATGGGSDVAHGRGDRDRGVCARGLRRRRAGGPARRPGDERGRWQRRRRARARGRRARRAGRSRRRRAAHAPGRRRRRGLLHALCGARERRADDGRGDRHRQRRGARLARAGRHLGAPLLGPAGTPIGLSPGGATLVLAWRPGEDEQAAFRRRTAGRAASRCSRRASTPCRR